VKFEEVVVDILWPRATLLLPAAHSIATIVLVWRQLHASLLERLLSISVFLNDILINLRLSNHLRPAFNRLEMRRSLKHSCPCPGILSIYMLVVYLPKEINDSVLLKSWCNDLCSWPRMTHRFPFSSFVVFVACTRTRRLSRCDKVFLSSKQRIVTSSTWLHSPFRTCDLSIS
jgi:hypothetical protein